MCRFKKINAANNNEIIIKVLSVSRNWTQFKTKKSRYRNESNIVAALKFCFLLATPVTFTNGIRWKINVYTSVIEVRASFICCKSSSKSLAQYLGLISFKAARYLLRWNGGKGRQ